MQEIGTVISTLEGPSSNKFSFVIKETEGIPVRKGQFVQLDTEEGVMIARVSEIIKTNRYFMRAESVREFERNGRTLPDMFPVDRWEYLVADVVPLGIFSGGKQQRISFPPSPGQKVFQVDENILSKFLGLDENGVNIGKISFHNLDVKLNLTKLFQKHAAILAISGAGKSYLASDLIEEILDRSEESGRPSIVVMDPHGEYIGFGDDENYMTRTKIFNEKNISISASKLSATNLAELIPQMSSVQRRELSSIIKQLREKKSSYTLEDLINAASESEIDPRTSSALASWLADLNSTGLFSNVDSPSVEELAKPGQLSIFDLSEFVHLKNRQIILTYFGRKLFEARRKDSIPPFILFVEEAHQFAPGGELEEFAVSRPLIEQIAREGRKFNACLVLISQRPKRLSTTALSQCNTHIILRVTNPMDIQHIEDSSEGITADIIDMIPGLKVGEALVVGEAVNYPLLVKIRERKSKKLEKGMKFEDALKRFKEKKALEARDLDSFM